MAYRGNGGIWALWCALGLLLTGCPNPNIYGTPRTLPQGKLSHTIAAEGVGYRFERRDQFVTEGQPREAFANLMVPPSYTLRLGLVDRLDMGVRAANLSSLGLDLKLNFVRTEVIDLAIDPLLQWSTVLGTTHLHAPLLVGINLGPKFTILLTPGVMYGFSDLRDSEGKKISEIDQLMGTSGLYGRLGLGFNARITEKLALQPEITALKALHPPADSVFDSSLMYIFGFGITLGRQPSYAETETKPAPLVEPEPTAPTTAPPSAPATTAPATAAPAAAAPQ
ncbi:MAG: hypothetical protein QM756_32450 [Polyangiaceae bacterium]